MMNVHEDVGVCMSMCECVSLERGWQRIIAADID